MSIENYIERRLSKRKHLLFTLLDAEEPVNLEEKIKKIERCDVDALLVGGSTIADQIMLDQTIQQIKKITTIPVILFPGNITGISQKADAILFSSLLNSDDPYFIIGIQALAAPTIRKFNLEAIPMGYIIIGEGQAAGFVGRARSFPQDKPELVASYALAAHYLGMRYVYLEAGSGAKEPVSPRIVKYVRKIYPGKLMVGGGIKSRKIAAKLISEGADILVIGNLVYEQNFDITLKNISEEIHMDV
jgi:phosphoglycerol geranylgeranyltransferase